jgi:SAM-dependent methyltransferase
VSDTEQTQLERYGDRLFNSARLDEFRRLDSLARAFNGPSRTHLSALGLPADARCLDVGAGTGDVSRILCDLVPEGEVVALDRDTVFLKELSRDEPRPNLTVLEGDITTADLEPGQFDLVHARFVLMHLRDRETLLPRLLEWVRPGGWLVVSDAADLGPTGRGNDAYRDTLVGLYQAIRDTIGSDINFGRRYPQVLLEHGLGAIGIAADVPPVSAGSPLAEFWQLTLGQARPRIIATGLSDEDRFESCLRYLEAPTTWDFSISMVTAWGQRP